MSGPETPPAGRRARHHTSDENLDAIKASGVINLGRPSMLTGRPCVHVELEPFGPIRPSLKWFHRPHTPKADLGIDQDGAYVEFDLPSDLPLLITSSGRLGPRNTGEILTEEPLSLHGLNPLFVRVRWFFWVFWRSKAE